MDSGVVWPGAVVVRADAAIGPAPILCTSSACRTDPDRLTVRAAQAAGLGRRGLHQALETLKLLFFATGSGKTENTISQVLLAEGARLVLARLTALSSLSPVDRVTAFFSHLITLWRRADAGFARALALFLRVGQFWTAFRSPAPPGRQIMASSHATRGPDGPQLTQPRVICGEPHAWT